jgi:hypothetical protein
MADSKLVNLVKLLNRRTVEGNISWERTSDEGVFNAPFKEYSVQISTAPTRGAELEGYDIVLRIYDDEGEIVEEIRDVDFTTEEFLNPYGTMNEIYLIARRQAMGVDKAVDSLLNQLIEPDDDIPF